jgi:hypothetical protein
MVFDECILNFIIRCILYFFILLQEGMGPDISYYPACVISVYATDLAIRLNVLLFACEVLFKPALFYLQLQYSMRSAKP